MPKSDNQKLKILYILDYLQKNSHEDHPVRANELIAMLNCHNISCDRKTVYSDIQALQDYGVAEIIGTQSYGKGIVQSVFDLQDGTALKLTTAKYYTPNGNDIHEIGITPDVEIDLPEELKTAVTLSFEEDVQLQKAIEVLQQ
jgi:hypothetical protein